MKHMRIKSLIGVFLGIFLVLLTTSCDLAPGIGDDLEETGAVILRINDVGIAARTMLPDISMDIESYTISGNGPNGATFTAEISRHEDYSRTDLRKGNWIFTVEAYNAAEGDSEAEVIGRGTNVIYIQPGIVNEVSIIIAPLPGPGELNLTVDWNLDIANPRLEYQLTDSEGHTVDQSEEFVIDNRTGILIIPDLSAGYYMLEVTLFDSNTVVARGADALRIVSGNTTEGELSVQVNLNGVLDIHIDQEMDNPFSISLSGISESIVQGTSMTVSVESSEPINWVTWFLNGARLSEEYYSPISIGAGLSQGEYRLTCVVRSDDVLISTSADFVVTTSIYTPPAELNLIFNEGFEQQSAFSDGLTITNRGNTPYAKTSMRSYSGDYSLKVGPSICGASAFDSFSARISIDFPEGIVNPYIEYKVYEEGNWGGVTSVWVDVIDPRHFTNTIGYLTVAEPTLNNEDYYPGWVTGSAQFKGMAHNLTIYLTDMTSTDPLFIDDIKIYENPQVVNTQGVVVTASSSDSTTANSTASHVYDNLAYSWSSAVGQQENSWLQIDFTDPDPFKFIGLKAVMDCTMTVEDSSGTVLAVVDSTYESKNICATTIIELPASITPDLLKITFTNVSNISNKMEVEELWFMN